MLGVQEQEAELGVVVPDDVGGRGDSPFGHAAQGVDGRRADEDVEQGRAQLTAGGGQPGHGRRRA